MSIGLTFTGRIEGPAALAEAAKILAEQRGCSLSVNRTGLRLELCPLGGQLNNAPEGAGDIHYNAFHLDGLAVGETTFTLDGVSCAYRIALTYDTSSDFADISGVAEEFDHRAEAEVGWCPARLAWNDGGAGKVVWFDVVPGQLYSLSVDAGAGRESLLDLASQLFLPAQDEL